MENILFKRIKHLITRRKLLGVLLLIAIISALVLFFFEYRYTHFTQQQIYETVIKGIQMVEHNLGNKTEGFHKRAAAIYRKYRANTLHHSDLKTKEALILENNGVIEKYWGELYYFKIVSMKTGEWSFIENYQDIYFIRKMGEHLFYIRYFCNLDNNIVLQATKNYYSVSEVRYSSASLHDRKNQYYYDEIKDMFFYSHRLEYANGQLILYLKFTRDDLEKYYKKREGIYLICVLLVFLLILLGWSYYNSKNRILPRLIWLTVLVDLFFLLPLLLDTGGESIYLKFMRGSFTINSIYQLLIIQVFLVSAVYFFRNRFKIKILFFILFNATLVLVLKFSSSLFNALNFNYQSFSLKYMALLLLLLFLYLLPLVFIRGIAIDFYKQMESTREKLDKGSRYILIQVLVVLALSSIFNINMVNALIISLASCMILFFRRSFLSRAAVIFLIAASVYQLTAIHTVRERREFITDNLKNVFQNQGNYAKFIAREIVHQINSETKDFYELFQDNSHARLENMWRKTIAFRETIASGIFVVSEQNELLSNFAFQLPYMEPTSLKDFPFWAIEDSTALIHGKEIPLAVASIAVYKDSVKLGHIIVIVLNSPELLLKYQERVNIFTIDKKINGKDLSYITLNKFNQILENPSNINLENVSGILTGNDKWIHFESLELTFEGYIFSQGGRTTIIFYPMSTIFKEFAQVIKVFLFFSIFYFIFFIKDFKRIRWRTIYYSYSIRVFSFLIFISLLTAIVFSILFINFSYRSSEQKVMRIMYENGRLAQNIGFNLIKEKGDFSRDHLLAIADILNGDVTVYENGALLQTSNYRKFIHSQIPEYVHSLTLSLINEKNQRFVLIEDKQGFHLFYKIYEYIFLVEYSNKWEEALKEERYYADFIITLFFILIIVGFLTAVFFRNKILSPIQGLNQGMAEVERGNLPVLEDIPTEIEIKSLYTGFNSMIAGIREQKKNISELSRMKTIIRLGRHVAHEVKNPLTPIQLSAEQILRSLQDKNPNYEEIIKQSVNYIIDETEHLRKVSYGFLDLSKLDEINAETFDLMEMIQDEMFSVRQVYGHIKCSVLVDGKTMDGMDLAKIPVTLDKIKIKQVLKNLINNSVEAIGEKKGELRLTIQRSVQRVRIVLHDTGIGMNESEYQRAFEKDYSTKEIGTGLGLFIVKRIIELHKGTIDIESKKDKGTSVILNLPVSV
jgi:signal transduction histidine kinase